MAAPPWVILRRRLGLVSAQVEAERPVPISVALREPPRVTVLDVSPRLHRGPRPFDKLPYLVATGPGVLLVCFAAGEVPTVTDDLVLVRSFVSPGDPWRQPTTGSPDLVPRRAGPMPASYDIRSVGLTTVMFGGYLIAELRVTRTSDRAKLLRLFSLDERWFGKASLFSRDDQWNWAEKDLSNPLPTRDGRAQEWSPSGVLDHDKKLWWFDLSWGLISCDPNVDDPVLRFHDLPPGRYLVEPRPFIHTIRCICVSDHMLRYVDIARDIDVDGIWATEEKVVMWTGVPSSDGGDGDGDHGIRWEHTYEMSFQEIWNDASYGETQLPAAIPEIVLVHPRHPNVVYFFLGRTLFAVDVLLHRVVWFVKDAHKLVAPGCRRCVLPWDLPASIANGIVDAVVPSEGERGSSSTTPGASSSGVGNE